VLPIQSYHSHQQLQNLLYAANEAIIVYNVNGRITKSNKAACYLFKYTEAEAQQLLITQLIPNIATALEKSRQRHTLVQLLAHKRLGITFQAEVSLSNLIINNEVSYMLIIRDVSATKYAQTKLKALSTEVEALYEHIETLNYAISHDLRTPLRHANAFTTFLQERHANSLGEQETEFVDLIGDSLHKMQILINNVLKFSRTIKSEKNFELVPVNVLVEQIVEKEIAKSGRRGVAVIIENLQDIKADVALLETAFGHLIANAIKFSAKCKQTQINIACVEKEDTIVYYVKDNGCGFDMAYQEQLFTPFKRLHTDNEFEGTGIGLAIVDRIVKSHGGEVWAKGELDKGATFYMSFPKYPALLSK